MIGLSEILGDFRREFGGRKGTSNRRRTGKVVNNRILASLSKRAILAVAAGVVFVASVGLSGCAGNYGRLVYDREINQTFDSYEVLPDHKYYVTGPEGKPFAVMGIHRDYTLVPGQWREVKPTPKEMEKWIWTMNDGRMFYSPEKARGHAIVDFKGKRVGIWYSVVDWTLVRSEEGVQILVATPDTPEFIPSTNIRSGRGRGRH